MDYFHLVMVHLNALSRQGKPQGRDGWSVELARFDKKLILQEPLKYSLEKMNMFGLRTGENQNVVKVNKNDFVQHIYQNIIEPRCQGFTDIFLYGFRPWGIQVIEITSRRHGTKKRFYGTVVCSVGQKRCGTRLVACLLVFKSR